MKREIYQIYRMELNHGQSYRFDLVNEFTQAVVMTIYSKNIAMPRSIQRRKMQLNDKAKSRVVLKSFGRKG